MVKIYTKTGDKGETSLYTGERVAKSHPLIEALGSIDECNSAIGTSVAHLPVQEHFGEVRHQLLDIQHALFDVGAALATPRTRAGHHKLNKTRFDADATDLLEQWIDVMETHLPELKAFIIPGGHPAGACLHLARSICRRAERQVIPLHQKGEVEDSVLVYLNRLSDYLFVASRYINCLTKKPEMLWEQHRMQKA